MATAATQSRTTSLDDILTARFIAPQQGQIIPKDRFCKSLLLDSPVADLPTFDINKMCATVTISTPTPDRSEDVVMPEGIMIDNYRRNPVVYFDHGFDIQTPIAKSEDPDGNLTLVITPDKVVATSYFDQSIPESAQIFDLIMAKFVRAASINFTPIEAKVRTNEVTSRGRPGLQIDLCELLEWSWVGIPDNPEAVTKLLSRNRLAGKPISDPIRKSLQRYAAPNPFFGRGWTAQNQNSTTTTETDAVAKKKFTKDQLSKMTPAQRKAAQPEMDEESLKAMAEVEDNCQKDDAADPNAAVQPGTEATTEADPEAEAESTDSSETPLGAQRLGEFHSMLSSLEQQCRSAFGPVENVPVRDAVMQMCDALAGMCDEAGQLYASSYPDQPALKSMDEASADSTDTVAKLLAGSATNRLAVQGAMARVKSLLGAKNLTSQQKSALQIASSGLSRVVSQAERASKEVQAGQAAGSATGQSASETKSNSELAEAVKAIHCVSKQFEEIGNLLKNAIPRK